MSHWPIRTIMQKKKKKKRSRAKFGLTMVLAQTMILAPNPYFRTINNVGVVIKKTAVMKGLISASCTMLI